jgi:DNA-binding protein H-NS
MAVNEWKIWKKIGIVKKKEVHLDVETDVKAVLEFLKDANKDAKKVAELFEEYMELRGGEKILKKKKAPHNKLVDNIKKQIEKYDQILKAYEFLQMDADVNGERVKNIAKSIKRKAKKAKVPRDWINHMKTDMKWTFDW